MESRSSHIAWFDVQLSGQTLSDNPLEVIEPEAFRLESLSVKIFLLRTTLKKLSSALFAGLHSVNFKLIARNRTAGTMYYSIPRGKVTIYLNSLYSYDEAIVVIRGSSEHSFLRPALLSMGFTENQNQSHVVFLPCPLGSFSKSLGSRSWKCVYCPPGGFYSDTLGYVADGCKKCPNGSYVAYDKKPGKSVLDCKTCPDGTETDFFAGHRACPCLKGHYRTHLFDKCVTCGRSGLLCQDEYASLKPGFWWQWRNESYKHRYEYFMKNLARELPALDDFSVQYPYSIPTPYRCQIEESCKGGLDSPCGEGYQGPLCAVCNPGYHKQFHSCEKCPSRAWIAGQASRQHLLTCVHTDSLKPVGDVKKHMFGYYHQDISCSPVQIFQVFCHTPRTETDFFAGHRACPCLEGHYRTHLFDKCVRCGRGGLLCQDEYASLKPGFWWQWRNESYKHRYESFMKNLALELPALDDFSVQYPYSIPTPYRCQVKESCKGGLDSPCGEGYQGPLCAVCKPDYSIKCQGANYNHLVIIAYISAAYTMALPAVSFVNRLMSTSLAVTLVNLGIGAVSRIPTENILNMADHHKDALAMKINMLKTQLQSGIIGKPSIAASAKGTGALSFSPTHEENERKGRSSVKSRMTRKSLTKCERVTQTEIFAPVSTATAEHAQVSRKACQQITMIRHSDHHRPLAEVEEGTSKEEKTDWNNGE
ncbi:uncharacterized protein LOC113672065 [Pocillopora damicornis]|nr:uncharacterized protein LOC113672065 [Pocillopora damicornis]